MGSTPNGAFPRRNPASRTVFSSILAHGPSSRGDVARRTGLSAASVTKSVRPLLAAGFLQEGDAAGGSVGRPVRELRVRPEAAWFAGVKVTGDEVVGTLTNLSGVALASGRLPLRSPRVRTVVSRISAAVRKLRDHAGGELAAACVAVSGEVERDTGLVRFSPFLDWHDVPLAELVEASLGISTVVENDVRALTLAESTTGAGVGASVLVVVTIGTGIGCGIVVDGRVLSGAHGVVGELGHIPLGDPATPCYCGGHGCVEAVAADPAIVRRVSQATGVPLSTIAEAAELARSGGPAAKVFADAGATLGRALATVANLVGPDRIIVSGEGLAVYDLFAEHVRTAFVDQAYGSAVQCTMVLQPHSFEDWALGAAAVARDAFLRGRTRDAVGASRLSR
ncbi:ROK family protein [Actinopolymorpha sp. B17G11]|uniref:ROK family protein n=1 Tax=Actinopolymorpha sp. B17G11 TaxID=3160861 RepID=UPI0032E42C6A